MLIAGFGGSANTYATYAIWETTPQTKLAHHLHAASLVPRAAKLKTPCLVLIRHPSDAVSSLTTRNGIEFSVDGLGWALLDYTQYYEAIIDYRQSFMACNFKDVIEDYSAVIDRFNQRFNTNFSVPENGSDASKSIIATHRYPGTRRFCTTEDVQALLNSPALNHLRVRAEQVYEHFCTLTGTRVWKDTVRSPMALRPKAPEKNSRAAAD